MNNDSSAQIQLMVRSAIERLHETDLAEVIRNTGVRAADNALLIESLAQEYTLRLPGFEFDRELEKWRHLTLLQYLGTADGTPLSGRWISLAEMPGGLYRGRGFDKDIALMFERDLRNVDAETFTEICLRLGGTPAEGKADVSMILMYAPRFPVLINFWESDDEFPCSGKVFVDANAHHYLPIEAAGGACSAVVKELIRQKGLQSNKGE